MRIWFLADLNFLIDHDFSGIMLRLLQEHVSARSYGSRFGEYCNTLEKLQSGFLDTNKSSPTGEKPEELFSLVISKSDSLVIYKIWSLTEDVAEVRVAVTILFFVGMLCVMLQIALTAFFYSCKVREGLCPLGVFYLSPATNSFILVLANGVKSIGMRWGERVTYCKQSHKQTKQDSLGNQAEKLRMT